MGYTHYWGFKQNFNQFGKGGMENIGVDKTDLYSVARGNLKYDDHIHLNKDVWSDFIDAITPILDEGIKRGILRKNCFVCSKVGQDETTNEMNWNSDRYKGLVRFNGIGFENSHEDFWICADLRLPGDLESLQRNSRQVGSRFCKTAKKPYDEYVVRVLIEFERFFGDIIYVSSDGGWNKVKLEYAKKCIDSSIAIAILEELNQSVLDAISGIDKGYEWDKSGEFFSNYIIESYLDNPSVWDEV